MKPEPDIFKREWPAAFEKGHDEQLQLGYHRARTMLRPTPYPDDAEHPKLPKMAAHEKAAEATGTPTSW